MHRLLLICAALTACGEVDPRKGGLPDAAGAIDAPGPTAITLTSYNAAGRAANTALVAFQDGDGAWQVLSGQAGVYSFTVTHQRYGLLAVCARDTGTPLYAVSLSYYAASDGASRSELDQCTPITSPAIMISGTVAGTQQGDQLTIDTGDSSQGGIPVPSWTLPALAGPGILLAERRNANQRPVAMLFDRVTYAAGKMFALDFASAVLPAEAAVTLDPTGSNVQMFTSYLASDGTSFNVDQASGAATSYRVVPTDHLGDGLSMLGESSSNGTTTARDVRRVFKTPLAQTLTLPPAYVLPAAPHVVAATPYPIFTATLPARSGAQYYRVSYFAGAVPYRSWTVTYSAGWLAGTTGDVAIQLPDLSALAGWRATYALPASNVQWTAAVGTGPLHALPGTSALGDHGGPLVHYQDGDEMTQSSSNGTVQ